MIRGGDFTHPGNEEAIELALETFSKNPNRLILDVACGLGGTADFIQKNDYGKVIGLDIEEDSITYACNAYPAIEFLVCDAQEVTKTFLKKTFDLICIFSAFLVFQDQSLVLKALRQVAKDDAQLVIFDYTDLLSAGKNPLVTIAPKDKVFNPIRLDTIQDLLRETGWQFSSWKNLDEKFLHWYEEFQSQLNNSKQSILQQIGEVEFTKISNRYHSFLEAFRNHTLGGGVLIASAKTVFL